METSDVVATKMLDAVRRRLDESPYQFQRRVDVAVENGIVTLRGQLPTFFLKQTAQTLAGKVAGVRQIVNLVDVPGNGFVESARAAS